MGELTLGWATDLAVLRHTGSLIENHGDHLVGFELDAAIAQAYRREAR
jgi:hypothetical protein